MFEVEAKVKIIKADFERLQNELGKSKKIKKIDSYYSESKDFTLRIRESGKSAILNIKLKEIKNGIENNQEMDFPLTSKAKFENLLKHMGITRWAKKQKISEVYSLGNMNVELNHIPGLGFYLEIERVVKSKSDVPKAKKELNEQFKKFGFSPSQFEKKYYLELLSEQGLL